MPSIRWDQTKPAGGDSIGIGDEEIRSTKTALQVALDAEHVFPSAGGDAGVHRFGAARPYFGVQSAVSSTGTDGRLMQTSDTSRLFGVGSGGTTFIGGPTVIAMASFPGAVPQRHYWAMETGFGTPDSSGSLSFTFPNSGFSGVPIVLVSAHKTAATPTNYRPFTWISGTPTTTGFAVGAWDDTSNSAASRCQVWYQSIGTRVL